ncbi:MAG: Asp-tRNA(Asn)/Glu-tRNA(Gln) amidotransferase subunit GatA [Patescibacteria group bacterium]|nr:Asp-tRNA(Asn)/Glu-tRNA(Gln) amidotransferase subunit GatA [Patescibacteria group bacterium]MDE2116749.1 Asp-tRNA(Asn)/Glu-tRNA(Gln) amidotransferase subunit GatA [Patescibacteria group bacterium]
MIDLTTLTIKKAHDALGRGDFSARDLVEAYLAEISKKNKDIHAYLEVFGDVIAQAEAAQKMIDSARAAGREVPLLAGIPIAVKDNILISGRRAGSASKILEGYVAPYDATAIAKLRALGAVFIGRANMDEFAMGGSTENSAYGVTKNPRDLSRVSGGSSGGSAAAVAADMALAALGSDTGGSVRQPASYCGVVGLKPTYGSISRHGLMAMGSSLDVIGPLAKTVSDAEILFNAMKGKDRFDSTSIDVDAPAAASAKPGAKKPVIGVPRHFLKGDGIDPAVMRAFEESVARFKKLGYEVRDIELPNIEYSLAVYYVLMPAEVSTNLARFDGVKYGLHKSGANLLEDYLNTRGEGFGREARRRIMLGAYVLSSGYYDAYYNKAATVRELLKKDFAKAFASVDAIIMPTAPTPAFKIGEKVSDPVAMYLEDIFTVTANLVGVPAMSVPAGSKSEGGKDVPIGLQIIADSGREDILFSLGKAFLGEVE